MSEIERKTSLYKWLDEYVNSPVVIPTKEQAVERLKKLGVLTKSGRISRRYKGIIVKVK